MSSDIQVYWGELELLKESGENLVKNKERSLKALSLYAILQFAIQIGEINVIKSCIALGIPLNFEVRPGKTPLILGIDSDQPDVIKMLIELGADVNWRTIIADSPLHYAVDQGKARAAEALLKSARNRILINSLGSDGMAPLHRATKHNKKDMIKILARHGADVNVKGDGGSTPLHIAAACNICSEQSSISA